MKITETHIRECCQYKDLKPVQGCDMFNFNIPKEMFCRYCEARHRMHKFMDAAGSMDWEYRKVGEGCE